MGNGEERWGPVLSREKRELLEGLGLPAHAMEKQILRLKVDEKIRRLPALLQYVNGKYKSDIHPTARNKALSKKQIFTQLIEKFSAFHEAGSFIAAFLRALEPVEFSEHIEALFKNHFNIIVIHTPGSLKSFHFLEILG
jgi:hypothetical protein